MADVTRIFTDAEAETLRNALVAAREYYFKLGEKLLHSNARLADQFNRQAEELTVLIERLD